MSSKPKSVLQLRTQEKIQHLLLDLFNKSEMSSGGKSFFISVNSVDISPDLRNLKIFIDVANMDGDKKNDVVKSLNGDNIYIIKDLLAKKMNLRYVPEPLFVLDESSDKLYKMGQLIEKESRKYKK